VIGKPLGHLIQQGAHFRARQQFGYMRPTPPRRQDHQVGNVGLDQHFRQFEVPREHVDEALVSFDPEDLWRCGMLRVDIDKQCLDAAFGCERQSQVERGERLALARPCTRHHDQPTCATVGHQILLRPRANQISLDEAEFLHCPRTGSGRDGDPETSEPAAIKHQLGTAGR